MRTITRAAIVAAIFLILAGSAAAQFIGFTTPQSTQQTIVTNGACNPTITTGINNLGQTVHALALTIVTDTTGDVVSSSLQGSNDGVTFFLISDKAVTSTISNQQFLNASGYFPVVRAVISCSNAATRVSAVYSGTAVTQGPTFGDVDTSYYDKVLIQGQPANAGFTTPSFFAPYGNLAGFLSFQYLGGAGPAGSTLTLSCNQLSTSATNYIFSLPTATPLLIPIAEYPCEAATIAYTSGGASAATFTVVYLFQKQGFLPGVTAFSLAAPINAGVMSEKGSRWTTGVNNPAAGTQASSSRAAGPSTSTRHVADCVTATAGATTAPAANTNLTVNLRDGASGAGTILWSVQIVATTTAGQHGTITFCGLNLMGTANTAMTLEFAAGLANEFESVTLTGYDVQ